MKENFMKKITKDRGDFPHVLTGLYIHTVTTYEVMKYHIIIFPNAKDKQHI